MDMPFSTPSAAGHEVQLSARLLTSEQIYLKHITDQENVSFSTGIRELLVKTVQSM